MAVKDWILKLLDENGVPYAPLHHDRAFTAQELAEGERFPGSRVAKVVVVIADGGAVLAVLPASKRVDMDRLGDVLGTKDIHMASEKEMGRLFPDCEVGAEPPLRHWEAVELYADEALQTDADILFPGGTHEDGIRMSFADWRRLASPKAASFS